MCDRMRASYDALAAEYARRLRDELDHKPFDRAMLEEFAARVAPTGLICDLGCGPGHIARFLRDQGAQVFGLDLSEGMLTEARRLNPDISFLRGTMLALGIGDATLSGIVAFYSLIHFDGAQLANAVAEMHRVLRENGRMLAAFHTGGGILHTTELWNYAVDLTAVLFPIQEVVDSLAEAGFVIEKAVERDPYPEVEYQSRRAYILARKLRK
jgi:SAM-dependent methyltransferase